MGEKRDLRLSSILIKWYEDNKRDLPWRNTRDPYTIWISEIILQQTRVNQGYGYFNRFIEKYPTVDLLATANEDEVLKLWQGLGYYSRARNLHAAAKMTMNRFNGKFPDNYKDILSLKGVGEYTAAAIASFAYRKPYAVVDGNVYRVLSRIYMIDTPINTNQGKKIFAQLAQSLLDTCNPGEHNQSIMEFGALQCVPVNPDCISCPAQDICLAFNAKKVKNYPYKEKKQKVKERYFAYIDIRLGGDMFIHKRTSKDIWHNLYELPLIETEKELDIDTLLNNADFKKILNNNTNIQIKYINKFKHILSHQIIYASFYKVEINEFIFDSEYLKINVNDVENYPVSRLVHKYLENL